ncbi:MAG: hypothetical protein RR334_02700, partial [Clostridia bacterium]
QELARKNGNKPKSTEYAYTDENFYIVTDNKLGNFNVGLQLNIEENRTIINEITEEIENGTYRKSNTLDKWFRIVQSRETGNNWNNGIVEERQSSERNDSVSKQKSQGYTRGNFEENNRNVKYSLKRNSLGKNLTEHQAEFFKNSKVVDKDGNLQVVYHGSSEKFRKQKRVLNTLF